MASSIIVYTCTLHILIFSVFEHIYEQPLYEKWCKHVGPNIAAIATSLDLWRKAFVKVFANVFAKVVAKVFAEVFVKVIVKMSLT